jgi:hypothetical protein
MRRRTVVTILVAAVAALASTGQALANKDPHRSPVPNGPFDIPADVCGFPIHVDVPRTGEYQTVTTLPDGTQLIKITGSLVWTLTNTLTDASVTENISGPGTITVPPTGSVISVQTHGNSIFYVTNGADFGLPNLMLTSGLFDFSTDLSNDTLTAVTRQPNVKADLCAVLA